MGSQGLPSIVLPFPCTDTSFPLFLSRLSLTVHPGTQARNRCLLNLCTTPNTLLSTPPLPKWPPLGLDLVRPRCPSSRHPFSTRRLPWSRQHSAAFAETRPCARAWARGCVRVIIRNRPGHDPPAIKETLVHFSPQAKRNPSTVVMTLPSLARPPFQALSPDSSLQALGALAIWRPRSGTGCAPSRL